MESEQGSVRHRHHTLGVTRLLERIPAAFVPHQCECPIPCVSFCFFSSVFVDFRGADDLRPTLKRGNLIFCPGLHAGVTGKICCCCNRSSAKRKLFFQSTLGCGRLWGGTLSNNVIFQGTIRSAGISIFEAGLQLGDLDDTFRTWMRISTIPRFTRQRILPQRRWLSW